MVNSCYIMLIYLRLVDKRCNVKRSTAYSPKRYFIPLAIIFQIVLEKRAIANVLPKPFHVFILNVGVIIAADIHPNNFSLRQ